jgi:hypothetical protein
MHNPFTSVIGQKRLAIVKENQELYRLFIPGWFRGSFNLDTEDTRDEQV